MKSPLFSYHTFMLSKQMLIFKERTAVIKLLKPYEDEFNDFHITYKINILGCIFRIKHFDKDFPSLEVIVNPVRVLGDPSYKTIFNPAEISFCQVEAALNEIFQSLGLPYSFNDFKLMRLDMCVNIPLQSHEEVETYLKVIKKSQLPRYFKLIEFNDKIENCQGKNAHSFRIHSKNIDLTIYDKDYQMDDQNLYSIETDEPNLLRFEIALNPTAIKALKLEYHIDNNAEFLDEIHLNGICEKGFSEILPMIFPYGEYCSCKKAEEKLDKALEREKSYYAAVAFMKCLCRYQSINEAIQAYMKDTGKTAKQMCKILRDFEKASVNPVTIPEIYLPNRNKNYTLKSIPDLLKEAMI